VKLSELAVGIGPFVVGPAVERKIGLSAMSELAINASEWRNAEWARKKGLYIDTFDTEDEMDREITKLADRLASSSPDAMAELKKVFWQGTENWDDLLIERAGISGRLVLSEFAKNALNSFKKK
jgi:methylglutaconyl-CoA hydratase